MPYLQRWPVRWVKYSRKYVSESYHISLLVTSFPFSCVCICSAVVCVLQVCNYGLKRLEPDFPQGTAWEQTGVWEPRSGSTVAANYRDRHQGGSHHCQVNVYWWSRIGGLTHIVWLWREFTEWCVMSNFAHFKWMEPTIKDTEGEQRSAIMHCMCKIPQIWSQIVFVIQLKKCNNKINKIKRKKYIYIDEINTLLNTHT